MAEYELFIISNLDELKDGEEQVVNVRDTANYETRTVKAILSSSPEKLPGSDILRIRWQRGYKHPEPWAIRILETYGSLGEINVKEYL
ncbi:conserved hypothetical protein [uncultured Desulfobacterium sp.]|jgi:hypothetical protein|uniref:Uncharacterized protein n=1 Tax=uncultured Desulfobacterium sp. TaxID=201089 RepID=A0A445MSH1_9BACT|nr:conserved hypothetical protein [uncultured Desulfobacterium sp.]